MPDLTVWPTDGADGSVSSEARWRKMARLWSPSGVASGLVCTAVAGPAIQVSPGTAWLDGHFAELTTQATLPVTANGLLVLRLTVADNRVELLYRDGASAPTQTDPTWELPLVKYVAGVPTNVIIGVAPHGAPVVGALPPFPYEGQQVILWSSFWNRGWHCTYFGAAPAPYKWLVTGGPPCVAYTPQNENMAVTGGIGDLPTIGPDLPIPMTGVYDVQCGFQANNSGPGCVQSMSTVQLAAPTTPVTSALASNPGAAAATNVTVAGPVNPNVTLAAAGTYLRGRYQCTGSAGYFGSRWIMARPIRFG